MRIAVLYVLFSLAISIFAGIRYGELLVGADAFLSGVIDVFAILAGVLVAVISIVGDPSMLIPGNWRVGYEHAKDMQDRIARFSYLFSLYIITIGSVLFLRIVDFRKIDGFIWLYKSTLVLSIFGILVSITLPFILMSIQKERMSEEVRRRKERANDT